MHELTVIDALMAELDKARAEAATLRAELEGLRADAERYRWLRLNPRECADAADDALYIHKKQRPELFDAAIDAAKADKEGA